MTDVSVGTTNIASHKQMLRRTQRLLYNRYDWPFLKHMPYLNCANGQRFYDAPTGLNMERIISVTVWYGNIPSPIERGILLMGTFEMVHRPDTPYRVIINEAIELAKGYGGTDGHRFVNGVLDKLAARLRPEEFEANQQQRRAARAGKQGGDTPA